MSTWRLPRAHALCSQNVTPPSGSPASHQVVPVQTDSFSEGAEHSTLPRVSPRRERSEQPPPCAGWLQPERTTCCLAFESGPSQGPVRVLP